ncbi:hypothetical protein DVR09_16225 (plasmid) [Erythrobacter aureus]|uniref:Uncharacterized protein n=1 Tax=Erythrobacter aureus TaxID=2182384 RepID=A0A345YJ97_9SPHN|nr:hypothetical protein DVR09_16225 [Erythrobacter aureus]
MPLAAAPPSPKITVHTVLAAGCNLEPIECIHCGDDENVTFNQGIGDAHCATCGEWQLEDSD